MTFVLTLKVGTGRRIVMKVVEDFETVLFHPPLPTRSK